MTPSILFFLAGAILAGTVHGSHPDKFTVGLYQTLAQNQDFAGKNMAFSPYSIETALTLAYIGAAGNTKSEMATALGIDASVTPEKLGEKFKAIRGTPGSNYTLTTAIESFLEKTLTMKPEYKNNLITQFDSNISPADFKRNYEAERIRINTWVEGKTNDKIKNLLKQGIIDSDTKLVLVNALYFKATWKKPFATESTGDGVFTLVNGEKKTVKMMSTIGGFANGESAELGGAKILELSYVGDETSMFIVLSNRETGLEALERNLTAANLNSALGNLRQGSLDITLPKFKVESGFGLVNTLQSLGMKDAFSPSNADFSGISDAGLFISAVEHKAFVEVDEYGTEAAAATAVVMTTRSMQKPFHVDRPFLFLIRHNKSKSILFVGRVADPSAN